MARWNLSISAVELADMITTAQTESQYPSNESLRNDRDYTLFCLGAVSALQTIYKADELKADRLPAFLMADYRGLNNGKQ